MEDRIVIDRKTLKALAVDTRMDILRLLSEKDYTLSDIASMLGLKCSTVKEHLDKLVDAGLVCKEKTGRKWKFYYLTFKGKILVKPFEVKILFAFVITFIAAIGSLAYFVKNYVLTGAAAIQEEACTVSADSMTRSGGAFAEGAVLKSAPAVAQASQGGLSVGQTNPMWVFALVIALVALSAFLLGYYVKRKIMIIRKGDDEI